MLTFLSIRGKKVSWKSNPTEEDLEYSRPAPNFYEDATILSSPSKLRTFEHHDGALADMQAASKRRGGRHSSITSGKFVWNCHCQQPSNCQCPDRLTKRQERKNVLRRTYVASKRLQLSC
jgi:hypothetical protein